MRTAIVKALSHDIAIACDVSPDGETPEEMLDRAERDPEGITVGLPGAMGHTVRIKHIVLSQEEFAAVLRRANALIAAREVTL